MRKAIIFTIDIVGCFSALILYVLSGKRIVTRTARRIIARNSFLHQRRIEEMQRELDKVHRELRGWTASDNRMEGVKTDTERDKALRDEFAAAISFHGFRCSVI